MKQCVLSCVQLFVTPCDAAHQTPLSMGFPRQEHWNGLPFLPPGNIPDLEASDPITSWEIDGETVETVSDFIFGGLQNHCRC